MSPRPARPGAPGVVCRPARHPGLVGGLALCLLALVVCLGSASAEPAERMFDPRFREGAPSDQIAAGPPRLSRGHLNAFVDLFETAFDLALPAADEQALRDALEEAYGEATEAQRDAFLALVDVIAPMKARARCCDWRFVNANLRRFRAEIDKRVRAAPKQPVNAVMLSVLRRRHEVVWPGDPALKALAVESYLEMVLFVAGLGRNEAIELSPGRRTALIDYLGKDLRTCPHATRTCLVEAHKTWLRSKARWDRGRDARRLAMRWEAVGLLARLAPRPGGLEIRGGPGSREADHTDYAREASKVQAADARFDAVTALARNPQALLESLCRGLGLGGRAPPFTFLYR